MRVGVISDTHGLMRPQALEALRGCEAVLHAGDIGSPDVLDALRLLAPLTCVRGNNDTEPWANGIPESVTVEIEGVRVHLVHDLEQMKATEVRPGVIVSGHSHRPVIETHAGVLYFNPGSAGPRRFKLPVAVGILEIAAGSAHGRIIELEVPARAHDSKGQIKSGPGDRGRLRVLGGRAKAP
jgi:uncharacterized protein